MQEPSHRYKSHKQFAETATTADISEHAVQNTYKSIYKSIYYVKTGPRAEFRRCRGEIKIQSTSATPFVQMTDKFTVEITRSTYLTHD